MRADGTLETLSGFNEKVDPMVTHYYQAGDAAMDDEFLDSVFERYFVNLRDKKDPTMYTN